MNTLDAAGIDQAKIPAYRLRAYQRVLRDLQDHLDAGLLPQDRYDSLLRWLPNADTETRVATITVVGAYAIQTCVPCPTCGAGVVDLCANTARYGDRATTHADRVTARQAALRENLGWAVWRVGFRRSDAPKDRPLYVEVDAGTKAEAEERAILGAPAPKSYLRPELTEVLP